MQSVNLKRRTEGLASTLCKSLQFFLSLIAKSSYSNFAQRFPVDN